MVLVFDVLFQSQQCKSAFIQIQVLNPNAEQQYFEHVVYMKKIIITTSTQMLKIMEQQEFKNTNNVDPAIITKQDQLE